MPRSKTFTCTNCLRETVTQHTKSKRVEICPTCLELLALEDAHKEGAHDDLAIEGCPLCVRVVSEAATSEPDERSPRHVADTPTDDSLDPQTRAIVEDWKRGSSIAELARTTGLSRSNLRRTITKAVGGKHAFAQLRQAGAGGSTKRDQKARRLTGGPDNVSIDPPDIPVIHSAKLSDGWKSRMITIARQSRSVHIDPDGVEYIVARANERADLIYRFDKNHKHAGLPDVRLRRYDTSRLAKRKKKQDSLKEALREADKTRRRTKRMRRKAVGR